MQYYDEAYFRAKANRRAGTTWLILLIFVTIYYCSKDSVVSWDGQIWKITMAVVGWSTYITAGLFLKFKGMILRDISTLWDTDICCSLRLFPGQF